MTQIFLLIRSIMAKFQIIEPKNFENRFNLKRSIIFVYSCAYFLSMSMALIEATTIVQYSTTLYSVTTGIVTIVTSLVLYLNIFKIFELIKDFENGIQMRKLILIPLSYKPINVMN